MLTSPPEPIAVRRHGAGAPRVAVLHGGPGAPGSVASLARALSLDGGVLEPLQRGSGRVPLSVARHVADHAAVLPERVHLVGWSWGAMLALSYAAAHPERVHSLALIGCGTYDEESRAEYRRRLDARLGPEGRAARDRLKREREEATEEETRDRLLARLGELAMRAQAVDPIPDPDARPGDELPVDADANRETWDDALRLQAEGVEPVAFAAIRAPVLMIHGREDAHPGASTRDRLRTHLPHLEYRELPGVGHTPWRERAGRAPCLEALRGWLAR